MELIVLGTGGTWPDAGGATSGDLVRHEGFNLYMDAGTGTFSRLQQHIPISNIDAVLITHGHPDHFVDLYSCFYARHYGGQGEPGLPLIAPTDFYGLFGALVSENGKDVARVAFDVRPSEQGSVYELGPFKVDVYGMAHVGVDSIGFRIEAAGSSLAYTGDSGPSQDVVDMARGSDVFLCEATWHDAPDLAPFHMSAGQAGEHAARSEAKHLLLTHIWPTLDTTVSMEQAAAKYDGQIDLAVEGMLVEIGR